MPLPGMPTYDRRSQSLALSGRVWTDRSHAVRSSRRGSRHGQNPGPGRCHHHNSKWVRIGRIRAASSRHGPTNIPCSNTSRFRKVIMSFAITRPTRSSASSQARERITPPPRSGTRPRSALRSEPAYWVVAAIAGIDPNVASVGSAAWGALHGRWGSCERDRCARDFPRLVDRLHAAGPLSAVPTAGDASEFDQRAGRLYN
jgi:hypothetical protein